jgi:2-dehydro-3-deoxygluconokinase
MKKLSFIGECMVELRSNEGSDTTLHQSFAGDVYNSAVYLKRCFSDVQVGFVTVVGNDTFSLRMKNNFEVEGLNTSFVFSNVHRSTGLYLIDTDESGERSFTYWRSQSAAKTIMSYLNQETLNALSANDMFMLSGISIAIIPRDERPSFFRFIEALKESGVKIVFDPNYRARLWETPDEASKNFKQALSLCDVALVGVEDITELFDIESANEALTLCESFGVNEIVIKNGPSSVLTVLDGERLEHAIIPVANVVDTTSAGDAFNGVYLGSRLNNMSISRSVELAAKAAGTVIQYRGAIIPKGIVEAALAQKS